MTRKLKLLLSAAVIAMAGATSAQAAPLTLSTAANPTYQQTMNSPCVIGDPSCNNPAGFTSTTLASAQSTYTNVGSPVYTVAQIRGIVGNAFMVGIDVNTTTQPAATEILDSFSMVINGVTQFLFTGPAQLMTNNNGNGYSDALLSGFNLTGFLDAATAQFFVTYHNATDGREEFFLISNSQPPGNVPEPASLALLGLGLLAAGHLKRRTSARTSI